MIRLSHFASSGQDLLARNAKFSEKILWRHVDMLKMVKFRQDANKIPDANNVELGRSSAQNLIFLTGVYQDTARHQTQTFASEN